MSRGSVGTSSYIKKLEVQKWISNSIQYVYNSMHRDVHTAHAPKIHIYRQHRPDFQAFCSVHFLREYVCVSEDSVQIKALHVCSRPLAAYDNIVVATTQRTHKTCRWARVKKSLLSGKEIKYRI